MIVSLLILGNFYVDDGKYLPQFLVLKIHNCNASNFFFSAWTDLIVIEKKMNH